MKTCTKCGREKPLTDYHKHSKQPSGLNPSCKECVLAKNKEYYRNNVEAVKRSASLWRANNIDKAKAAAKERYLANAETAKENAKIWASVNAEKRKLVAAKSAEKHRGKNRERKKEQAKRYRRDNPIAAREEGRMRAAIRRDREKTAGVSIKRSDWTAIIDFFETGSCLYCSTDGHKLTMDHWVPVSLGGKTEIGNLIPCCKSCNSKKGKMTPDEWMAKAGINNDRRLGHLTIPQFLELSRETLIDGEVAA